MVYFPTHLKYHRSLPLPESAVVNYGAVNGPNTSPAGNEHTRTHTYEPHRLQANGYIANGGDAEEDDTASATLHESIHGITRPVQAAITTTPEWRQAVTVAIVVLLHV
jgi:hypothetical protein